MCINSPHPRPTHPTEPTMLTAYMENWSWVCEPAELQKHMEAPAWSVAWARLVGSRHGARSGDRPPVLPLNVQVRHQTPRLPRQAASASQGACAGITSRSTGCFRKGACTGQQQARTCGPKTAGMSTRACWQGITCGARQTIPCRPATQDVTWSADAMQELAHGDHQATA